MAKRQFEFLSSEQAEQFLTHGYTVVRGAFSREQGLEWTAQVWTRLGYDPADESTWMQSRIHMPSHSSLDVRTIAPRAWGAICELVGGEERIANAGSWGDGFIVNLGSPEDRDSWQPPSASVPGWHKDGDFFRHYLDSPEQGLLTIVLWSDVQPTGGATFVATDSVPIIAKYMVEHPEGVRPGGFDFRSLIGQCHNFIEATGKAGDVFLLHPYILHASSQNALRALRIITNPPVSLREPLKFDRSDPEDYSLVELAILKALGAKKLAFVPTGPRERIVPERVLRQQKMIDDEKARIAAAS